MVSTSGKPTTSIFDDVGDENQNDTDTDDGIEESTSDIESEDSLHSVSNSSSTNPKGDIEMSLMQVTYSEDERRDTTEPIIHLYGIDSNNKKRRVDVTDFYPYFYVPTANLSDAETHPREKHFVRRMESGYSSIYDKELTKIETELPKHVSWYRDEFDENHEADVLFENRYLIDNKIQSGVRVKGVDLEDSVHRVDNSRVEPIEQRHEPHIATIDIEVEDRYGFPEDGGKPIISITLHDNVTDSYFIFLYQPIDGETEGLDEYSNLREAFTDQIGTSDQITISETNTEWDSVPIGEAHHTDADMGERIVYHGCAKGGGYTDVMDTIGAEDGLSVSSDHAYSVNGVTQHDCLSIPYTADVELESTDGISSLGYRRSTQNVSVDDEDGYIFTHGNDTTPVDDESITSNIDSFVSDGGDPLIPEYESLESASDYYLLSYSKEEQMLLDFIDLVEKRDYDCLTGWSFDDFDMPYILDRVDLLGTPFNKSSKILKESRLSRDGNIRRSDWFGPTVGGRVIFDLLEGYKRTQFSELDSYKLDHVANVELDAEKEQHDDQVADLWVDDITRLIEYNLRDVELCVELERQESIIAFWNEVRTFVGCKLEDATTPGDAVDMYMLHKANGKFVLPSKGNEDAEDYEGGAVFEPIEGIREWVTVLDLKSLYPMVMLTINASPETKVDPGTFDGDTFIAPNGVHFRKDEDGIIKEMMTDLLDERNKKKEFRSEHDPGTPEYAKFDRQQGAVKVIMNSIYGVLGWDKFRLYDKEMGAAVTAGGRKVIEYSEHMSENMGLKTTYGDTDSVMLQINDVSSKEEAIERSFKLEDKLNSAYDEFAREEFNAETHHFEMEFEKLYRRFFQAGKKKRYAGNIVWKEGDHVDKTDITGFEYKRSDIAGIVKETQKKVLHDIVYGEDAAEIESYLETVIADFKNKSYDIEQIGIPSGIGQPLDEYDSPTAHARGAIISNIILDKKFQSGDKPKRVYLTGRRNEYESYLKDKGILPDQEFGSMQNIDGLTNSQQNTLHEWLSTFESSSTKPPVICFDYAYDIPDEFEIDWDMMMDKTLKGPIERVISAIGIDWDELESEHDQTGLDSFV